MRGDARKPAVFHDDQICAGLDGEFTGRFGGADHSSHRGTQIGVFGFLDVFHVAVAPVEQAAQKVGWDVCLLYGVGMRWILLALMVLTGSLLRADDFEQTLKKAEQGNADAQCDLGFLYSYPKMLVPGVLQDYAEALKWYRKAANQGHAGAQFKLGGMHREGEGVSKDYAEALKWYHKAADQGDAGAQFSLGVMYREGEGVSKDYAEALKWYHKAADQGYDLAAEKLSGMYYRGEGVPKDYVRSYMWASIAEAKGSGKSSIIGDLEKRMTPAQIAEAQREARRRFENMPLSPVEAFQKVMREEREAKRRVEAIERK